MSNRWLENWLRDNENKPFVRFLFIFLLIIILYGVVSNLFYLYNEIQ